MGQPIHDVVDWRKALLKRRSKLILVLVAAEGPL